MHPLLRRIIWNASIAALLLGMLGFLFSMMLPILLPQPGYVPDEAPSSDKGWIALRLALIGAIFAIICDLLVYFVRGLPSESRSPSASTDELQQKLEALLKQVEQEKSANLAGQESVSNQLDPPAETQQPMPITDATRRTD